LVWGLSMILNRKLVVFRSQVYFPAAFYLVICAFSVAVSRAPYEGEKALRYMIVAAIGGFLAGNLAGKKRRIQAILWGLIVIAAIEAAWGIAQRLNSDPILRLRGDTFGTFGNSNYLGAFIGLMIPVVCAMGLAEYYRDRDKTYKGLILGILFLLLLVLSVGLVMTLCQGADLSTGVALLGIGVIWLLKSRGRARIIAMTVAGALISLLAAAILVASLLGRMPVKKLAYLGERAVSGRVLMWKVSMKMVQSHPIMGIGIGNFQINYLDYMRIFLKDKDMVKMRNIIQNEEKPHNAYVQVWSETGSAGLAGFLAMLAIFYWYRIRASVKIKDLPDFWIQIGIISGFFGFCALLFVSSLMVIAPFREYFWVFMGLTIAWERAVGAPEIEDKVVDLAAVQGWKRNMATVLLMAIPAIWLGISMERSSRHWEADVLWQKGINATHRGNIKGSIAFYDEALELVPRDMKLLFYRGSAVIKESDQQRNIEKRYAILQEGINNLVEARQGYADVNLDSNLAKAYNDIGRHEEAVKYYQLAADTGLKMDMAYTNLGIELMVAGRLEESQKAFEKALAANPKYTRAKYNFGLLLLRMHRPGDAEKLFEELKKTMPNSPEVFTNLGMALLDEKKVPEAVENFRKAIEIDAKNVRARNNLAAALWKLGKKQEADDQWREVLKIDPDNQTALQNLKIVTAEKTVK